VCGNRSVLLYVGFFKVVNWQFDALLVLISIVNLKLYIPWVAVGWGLGAVRLE